MFSAQAQVLMSYPNKETTEIKKVTETYPNLERNDNLENVVVNKGYSRTQKKIITTQCLLSDWTHHISTSKST